MYSIRFRYSLKGNNMNEKTLNNVDTEWTTEIKPSSSLLSINFKELWRYRDLIMLFVKRDFVTVYKQTILGPIWFFIQPIFTTVVFTIIFGNVAKIPTDGLPQVLFYMSGTIMWGYFSNCLMKTSDTFISNAAIFGKVYFPRLSVPLSIVISNIFAFLIQFALFLSIFIYYYISGADIKPNIYILLFPVLIIQMAILGMGVGLWISSLTTKYRDLRFLVAFGVQLWMYGTPVVYPLSIVPDKWRWLVALNPMAPIIEFFRYGFLGQGYADMGLFLIGIGASVFILLTGILIFNKVEKTFMDTV
jgi:lipopolysaccharide transport system permease protein